MDTLLEYINTFMPERLALLSTLEDRYKGDENIQPSIGPLTGALLDWLIQALSIKNVLEFGTCLGYSTLILANSLKRTGGHLTAIEFRTDMYMETYRNLKDFGLLDVVTLIQGDALQVINSLPGPFDLILQDSDKSIYSPMLDACVERLRPGGVLAADDALFLPMGIPAKFARPMDEYNRRVYADSRLNSIMLPIGDGLVLSLKKA
jgi:predicted O-methyltransferase YrrM